MSYVILCWVHGTFPETDSPAEILGSYTKETADDVARGLRCEYEVRSISTTVPEWATWE